MGSEELAGMLMPAAGGSRQAGSAGGAVAGDGPTWLANPLAAAGLGPARPSKLAPLAPLGRLPGLGTAVAAAGTPTPASPLATRGPGAAASSPAAGAAAAGRLGWSSGAGSGGALGAAAAAAKAAGSAGEDFASGSGDEGGAASEVESEHMSDFSDGSIEWP
jgi:hypothetical protein